MAVKTVVGLLDVVTVSNLAEFKSFLLIMCIDAPESTTNSLSSGLGFDGAGRHHFSEGEKNVVSCFSFNFRIFFGQPPTPLYGHLALATLSLPETDPQILEHWSYAHEVHLDKYVRAKDLGLECQRDVQRL